MSAEWEHVIAASAASSAASSVLFLAILILSYTPKIVNSCGSCCGILVMIPCIVIPFFGGMAFNAVAWGFGCNALLGCPAGFGCVFPCFGVFGYLAFLTIGARSGLIRYEVLKSTPALEYMSVCDSKNWYSSDGGIYFRDGSLYLDGELAPNFTVRLEHCTYTPGDSKHHLSGHWNSCELGLRPIFQDDVNSLFTKSEAPCAWAITADGSAPKPPSCRGHADEICGLAAPLTKVVPVCWGPDAQFGQTPEEACWRGEHELEDAVKAATHQMGLSYHKAAFITLGDPQEIEAELYTYDRQWWILAVLYTCSPAFLVCMVGALGKDITELRERRSEDEVYMSIE